MIDTVIANFEPHPCRDGVIPPDREECDLEDYPGWAFITGKPSSYQGEHRARFALKREIANEKYLTVYGFNNVVDGFKVSLPNMLYGNNSRLPTSQEEIDRALARVSSLVEEIAPVNLTSIALRFTHIHLTLHTRWPGVTAQQFFTCFRNFRHPRVHADAVNWKVRDKSSGIQILGENLKIGAYDKRLERHRVAGDVVRFEIKIRRRILKGLLGTDSGEFPAWLKFADCYSAFREIMLAFPSVRSLQAGNPLSGDIRLTPRQSGVVDSLLAESDSLRFFLESNVVKSPGSDLTVGEIVQAYAHYCPDQGWDPLPESQIGRQLPSLMLELFQTVKANSCQRDGKSARGFRGVAFINPEVLP